MRVRNPQGRVDWLMASLLERQVQTLNNPVVSAIHKQLKPELEVMITESLGPDSEVTKRAKRLLQRMSRLANGKMPVLKPKRPRKQARVGVRRVC